jgi:hypothetical protein
MVLRAPGSRRLWAPARAGGAALVLAICVLVPPAAATHGPVPGGSNAILAVWQSAPTTPGSTFTVSVEVADPAAVHFAYFTFCELTNDHCFQPIAMTLQRSDWFVGTTEPMSNYSGMTAGVAGGYNVTLDLSNNTTLTEPSLPNQFSNLTVATSGGFYYYEMLVEPEVHGLSGAVTAAASGLAIAGATVALSPGNGSTTTDAVGTYTFRGLVDGTYHLSITATGYTAATATVVIAGRDAFQNVSLQNANGSGSGGTKAGSGGNGGTASVLHPPGLYVLVGVVAVVGALLAVWAAWRRGPPTATARTSNDQTAPPGAG